jgi:hypothetical protein
LFNIPDGFQSLHCPLLQDFHCNIPEKSRPIISRVFFFRATMAGGLANGPSPRLIALPQVCPLNVLILSANAYEDKGLGERRRHLGNTNL